MANISFYEGDVLGAQCNVIVHQINSSGGFGSGVAGAIRKKHPEIAEEYRKTYAAGELRLGMLYTWKTDDGKWIANLCAQSEYGYDGRQYTSYDALWNSLNLLANWCLRNEITDIAMPYGMSSVRGGANWDVVLQMVKSAFENTNINIGIYKL